MQFNFLQACNTAPFGVLMRQRKSDAMSSATRTVADAPVRLPLEPVPYVDLARFAGKWHEIARLPNDRQRGCASDAVSTWQLQSERTLCVRTDCCTDSGVHVQTESIARQRDPLHAAAKLQRRFASRRLSWLPWVWHDYWVLGLDPDYRWALIGEPRCKELWILAREPRMVRDLFDELKSIARRMGYDLAPLIVSSHRAD